MIQWANKDHKYKRDISDWMRLCAKCHTHYDIKFNNKLIKNMSKKLFLVKKRENQ